MTVQGVTHLIYAQARKRKLAADAVAGRARAGKRASLLEINAGPQRGKQLLKQHEVENEICIEVG